MSFKCKIGLHSWNGCKCSKCGKTEENLHDWSNDCDKCSKCGKTRESQHDWAKDCKKCSKCGKTRDAQHDLKGCICIVCGKESHNWQADIDGCTRCGKEIPIATLAELQAINNDLDAHYCLVADIDARETLAWNNGKGFEPISPSWSPFKGKFNGNNHFITNLFINRPLENDVGLFRYVEGGILENIMLKNVKIKGKEFVGSLVGLNFKKSNISKCNSTGYIEGERLIGGLVGMNEGGSAISECSFSGEVLGIGESKNGTSDFGKNIFLNRREVSVLIIDANNVGGLVGLNYKSTIRDCSSSGKITGHENTGGLIGTNSYGSYVLKCFSQSEVNGGSHVGGLVGYNYENSTISECVSTGNVKGVCDIGGLVGKNEYISIISKCISSGNVNGKDDVGGLVGYNESRCISMCSSSGRVESQRVVGGLVGHNEAEISECFSSGKVIGKSKYKDQNNYYEYVGGMIGFNGSGNSCNVKQSYWDIQSSCQRPRFYNGEGIWKTTKEMKLQLTYNNWDFKNIWIIEANCYPKLRCLQPEKKLK